MLDNDALDIELETQTETQTRPNLNPSQLAEDFFARTNPTPATTQTSSDGQTPPTTQTPTSPQEPIEIFSGSTSIPEIQKAFTLKVIQDDILTGLFDLQGKLASQHRALYFLQFLATQTPQQVQVLQIANQILKNADANCRYTLDEKTAESERNTLNKADAANGLLGLAHKIEEKVFTADGQKLIPELKNIPHFLHFKSILRDPCYITGNPPVSTEPEMREILRRIKISEIQAFAKYLLELLQNNDFQGDEEETTEETTTEAALTEEEKSTDETTSPRAAAEAEAGETDAAGADETTEETELKKEREEKPFTADAARSLIDPRYQNQVAALSNASLIFLFASLGDNTNPFDFFQNQDVPPEIRQELQKISADLIYDLLLKYDGKDLGNASTKIRIIQEAALKFQQDPRFRFYFQKVIDTHYIALASSTDPKKAEVFAQRVTELSHENLEQFRQRLEHAITVPQTVLEKELAQKLELIKSFDASNKNYHRDFTNIFAKAIGESDETQAQLLASSIQDRFDYLIAAHYDSFIDFLDLGKIEILIGRQIQVDPSQRQALQAQLHTLLTDYWKLRVAEHATNLGTDGVAATWQAVTDEQKQAINSESDDAFRRRLESLHPPGIRSAGSGKDFVAAANLSEDDLPHLKETDKTIHYQFDAVEQIRKQLIQQTVLELQKQGQQQDLVVGFFITVEGTVAPDANLAELEMLLQFQQEENAEFMKLRSKTTTTDPGLTQSYSTKGVPKHLIANAAREQAEMSPWRGYRTPGLQGSSRRNAQGLDQALSAAGAAVKMVDPVTGRIITWLSNKNNRTIAAVGGITGFGLLLNSLQSAGGIAGAVGGAATGATIGFFAGGPIGALIGGSIGAVAGGVGGHAYASSKLGMSSTSLPQASANFFKGAGNAFRASGVGQIPGTGIGAGGIITPPPPPPAAAAASAAVPPASGTFSAVATGAKTALAAPLSVGAQAVVATLATTTVGTLFIVTTIIPSAFLIDFTGSTGSISLDTLQESKYVTAEKVATIEGCSSTKCDNPGQIDTNGDGKIEVTYSIKVTPKDNYSITVIDFSDIMALSFNDDLVPVEPTFTPEEIARRTKTLQMIKDNQLEGQDVFFDPNGDTITLQPGQALIWQYTEFFDERYNNTSVRNTFEMDFGYTGNGESGTDTVVTAERICFGECPDGLGCWPTTGNACQMPFGDFSHGPGSGNSYTTYADAIDICNAEGTPVYSPFDGELCFVSCDGGYGCHAELTPDGSYGMSETFLFAHFNEKPQIFGSDSCVQVSEGEFISPMGSKSSKGAYANPHLHFEVSNGGRWYNADPTFSYLLSIMPDGLTPDDKNSAIRSCYDE